MSPRQLARMLLIGSAVGGFLGLSATPASAAVIIVDSATDDGTGCTFREAITTANSDDPVAGCVEGSGTDSITFNIGTGTPTITPTTALPTINAPVIIDGNTGGATRVMLDGQSLDAHGLHITGGGSTVKALVINDFDDYGIHIDTGHGNTIVGSYIGTAADGITAAPNGTGGISVSGSDNHVIGGTTASDRNVVSGNLNNGVVLAFSTGHQVRGNYIGLGSDGTTDVGNQFGGVVLASADTSVVGGTTAGARNVISGNGSGVIVGGTSSGNLIQGNYIGVDAAGTTAKANQDGVFIGDSAVGNTVGGSTATAGACDGACNLIAGNSSTGVLVASGTAPSPNAVRGNFIGVEAVGSSVAEPNGFAGVVIDGTRGTIIGGTTPNERNVISGNGFAGGILVQSFDEATFDLEIIGNYIGLAPNGLDPRPNSANGVRLNSEFAAISRSNIEGNVVSGNGVDGIRLTGEESNGPIIFDTTIAGNTIGLNAAGTAAVANGANGIAIASGAELVESTTIGGTTAGDGNVISGNNSDGITLFGSGTTGVEIRRNSIHDNGGLGIDLADDDAVTPNDPMDTDTGANDGQNFPVLTGAVASGSQTQVTGTLNSNPIDPFEVEIFTNSACDASGNGEGETYQATTQVTTNASGDGGFTATIPTALPGGSVVTATATDDDGNSSEFSACATSTVAPTPPLSSGPMPPCLVAVATIAGTSGNDSLTGTSGADVIAGLGGNDAIAGLGGKDVICAGDGNDKASGGAGKDRVLGEAGKDNLKGSGGNDRLSGGSGRDICNGGAGKDRAPGCERERKIP